jgi:hypothetical protein
MRAHTVLIALALLGACKPKPRAVAPPPVVPVEAPLTVYGAAAKAYADEIYNGYARATPPQLVALASPPLHRALQGVDSLWADPLCDCETYGAVQFLARVLSADAQRANVEVQLNNLGRPKTLTLDLVMTPLGWRLDDVHGPNVASLKAKLSDRAARQEVGPFRPWGADEPEQPMLDEGEPMPESLGYTPEE